MRYRLRTLMFVLALLPAYIGLVGGTIKLARTVVEARERARQMTCTNTLRLGLPGCYPPPLPSASP